jgi:hypothetical protein
LHPSGQRKGKLREGLKSTVLAVKSGRKRLLQKKGAKKTNSFPDLPSLPQAKMAFAAVTI